VIPYQAGKGNFGWIWAALYGRRARIGLDQRGPYQSAAAPSEPGGLPRV
jgi:hypothetical protein